MNINPSCLSVGEIIHYVSNGTIESLDSEQVMRLVVHFEEEIEGLKEEEDDDVYRRGHSDGYEEAVSQMRNHLDTM
jgi:hypothetical protein